MRARAERKESIMESSLANYLFHQGTNFYAYDYLGCNLQMIGGKYTYTFRTWAPNADSVGLVSDFVGWEDALPMRKITDNGIWELVYESERSLEKEPYKYRIASSSGVHDKGDPYARFSRSMDDGASLIFLENEYKWSDKRWLTHRKG